MNDISTVKKDYLELDWEAFREKYSLVPGSRCRRCGKPMWNNWSLYYGYGPVCRRKINLHKYNIPGQLTFEEGDQDAKQILHNEKNGDYGPESHQSNDKIFKATQKI